MQIYFAPLEGITGFVFRNAYEKYYGGIDKYFTPFITPHTKKNMDTRERRDILPENNTGHYVVPQVLTNKAEELIDICRELKAYGYEEVNLNLGCPSKTVTTKGKGSGFLEYPDKMEEFFDRFFKVADVKLSIKTRIGYWEVQEAEKLFRLYEKFPFEEVIVHPRLGCEMYKGSPHYDVFETYLQKTKHSLCYNGDINDFDTLYTLNHQWEKCNTFMLGRGLIARPGMLYNIKEDSAYPKKNFIDFQICQGGLEPKAYGVYEKEFINLSQDEKNRFSAFHDELLEGYAAYLSGDRNLLFRMKELWTWWSIQFPGQEKILKQIKKTNNLKEYQILVKNLLDFLE